jgi:hypothetical protein
MLASRVPTILSITFGDQLSSDHDTPNDWISGPPLIASNKVRRKVPR